MIRAAMRRRQRHARTFGAAAKPDIAGAAPSLETLESRLLMSFDPTASEQLMLELLNRMRMDPAGELARLTSSLGTPATSSDTDVNAALAYFGVNGTTLASQWAALTAAAPLAWNESLINVAEAHNSAMIAGDVQSHEAPGEPPIASGGLRTRFDNQGYSSQSFIGENIFAYAKSVFHAHAALAIDWGAPGPGTVDGIQSPAGHRDSMMSTSFREVGIRITPEANGATQVGPLVITQNFGGVVDPVPQAYLLGVAYTDGDGDRFYDIGEGLSGVSVNVLGVSGTSGSYNTTSMTAGGWQLQVPAGTYQVTFSGGGLAVPVVRSNVAVAGDNVKIDSAFPEISVTGNAVPIVDGDLTPTSGDNTDFGSLDVDAGSVQHTFTIENLGTLPLTLSGSPRVQITGANAGDFTVTTQPATGSVSGGGSTSFVITFNPSAAGARSATVEILSDDGDESLYDFAVSGIGTQQPEIDIRGNLTSIADGDTVPNASDHTSFLNVNITGATRTRTYTIHNTGSSTLNLTGTPRVQIIGVNAADFTVTQQPAASVASGGTSTFDVTFDPSALGARNATVRVFSDDSDEALYEFAITGTGVNPEIDIQGNSTSIPDGDTTPRPQDFTDFRQVPVASTGLTAVTRTFTIRNTGGSDLTLAGPPLVSISGAHPGDFFVTQQPVSSTVASGGSTTFIITFNPSAAGLRTATVTVTSDDSDEGAYTFSIQGTGIDTTTSGNGLQIATLQEGTGSGAANGQGVSVYYTGYLVTGPQFDSNVGGTIFSFKLGAGSVIDGWEQGILGMKFGEKRTLVIPPSLGYGSAGTSNIPPNATLIFEVERVAPDMTVGSPQGGSVIAIPDGDTTPSTADHTDFGPVTLGDGQPDFDINGQPIGVADGVANWTFRITTTGALNLTGANPITISGPDDDAFTISSQPTSPIQPSSGSATAFREFHVAFNPKRLGLHTATISIASDDPDESPYTFAVSGTGIANRISGAVEDTDFVISYAALNDAMKETGTATYVIDSVQLGQLLKNGEPVIPGVTSIGSGQSLVWKAPANVNRTQDAFRVKFFESGAPVGDAEQIRIEITPVEDNPTGAIGDITLGNASDQAIDLASAFGDADITGTVARILTSLGAIDIHLFDSRTPLTVANFLKYASDGDYNNTIIHRIVNDVLVQGGGYRPQLPASHISTDPPVAGEFKVSNQRGTIAMVKSINLPNSATSEWFFNLDDNGAPFDNQTGGYTVFGEIVGAGMTVLQDIQDTPLYTDGQTLTNLPLRNYSGGAVQDSNWIKTISVATISNLSFTIVGNTNPALVTPSITSGTLNVAVAGGLAGSSDITIRATDLTGRSFDETFRVSVVGVSVEAIDDKATEPAGAQPANIARFRITRAGPTTGELTVNYTLGGTAGNGSDYSTLPLSAVIPAGQTSVDVDVTPLMDAGSEGAESVLMTISPSSGYTITGEATDTALIFDDKPIVAITANDASATEAPGNAGQVTVTRSGDIGSDLTVHLNISGTATSGADYTAIPVTVVIPANQASATIDVTAVNDLLSELNETVIIGLADDDGYVIDTEDEATVAIADDEPVLVQIAAADSNLGEGTAANPGVFRITRTGSTAAPLTVKFARGGKATFGPAGDYTLSLGVTNLTVTQVVIPAGTEFVDITVNVIDDTKADAGEPVTLTLVAGAGYLLPAVVASRSASMTIADNEPVVSVASVNFTGSDDAAAETDNGESGNRAFFRISRTGSTAAPLTVKFTKSGTAKLKTDYFFTAGGSTLATTAVTIPAGADHIDVFVDPVNDQIVESLENVILKLAANGTLYSIDPDVADQSATVTLADNEPFVSVSAAGFTGADAVGGEVSSGTANTARFRISRTTAGPQLEVGIKLTGTAKRSSSGDYVIVVGGQLVTSSKIVIPNNANFVDVIVSVNNDSTPEPGPAETVILSLTKASKAYKLDPDPADLTAQVTIADNEPVVSITTVDATASEPGGDSNTGKFRINRTGATTAALDVTLKITGTAVGGADYVKLPTVVTIPAGAAFVDIDIQPLVDAAVELPETVTVTIVSTKIYGADPAAASGTVTISNGAATAGPDLVILAAANPAKTFSLAAPTTPMTVTATVKNQGNLTSGVASQLRVLLSKDRAAGAEDIVLGTINLNQLAAGASATVNGSFNITGLGLTSTAIGSYYVLIVADHGGAVAESIETNNLYASFLANVIIKA